MGSGSELWTAWRRAGGSCGNVALGVLQWGLCDETTKMAQQRFFEEDEVRLV